MSRKLLQPLAMTVTGVLPNSVKSAEMSMLDSAPRWTPPSPPVPKILMPANSASNIVLAIVVPPLNFLPVSRRPQT